MGELRYGRYGGERERSYRATNFDYYDPWQVEGDYEMPVVDGPQVLQMLRQESVTEHIPVIFLTADESEGAEREGLALGAMDFIRKPFVAEVLTLRVRHLLELIRLQRDLHAEENREKLLADFEYSVNQKKEAETPAKMAHSQWTGADYKFQVNAAHVAAIYDDLDGELKRYGRRPDGAGIEVSSFLAGAKAALSVIAANTPHVWDWCHLQEVSRRYFDADE